MKNLCTIICLFLFLVSHSQTERIVLDTLGLDSLKLVYYKNEQLFYQVPYKNGHQNGFYIQFHENGQLWLKEQRVNDKTIDGYYKSFWDNGKIYQEGTMKNGVQIGKWLCYDSEGNPFKIYFYNKKGECIKLKVWNKQKQKYERTGLY